MRLFGSLTSPFVRRVRVVLEELALPCELVDVFTEEGQAELREKTPLWKVPAAEVAGELLWDSGVILDRLLADHGSGPLRLESDATRWAEARLRSTIDETLATLIKRFYLVKDGVDASAVPYLEKDLTRARSAFKWIEGELRGEWCSADDGFGRTELALYTTLDWVLLRDVMSLDSTPSLLAFRKAHEGRPSLVSTAPPR